MIKELISEKEIFYWASGLTEKPIIGESVLCQLKDFSYKNIIYTKAAEDWFISTVQCWLKKISADNGHTRIFYIDEVHKWIKQYNNEEISLSKFTEMLNEKATGIDAIEFYKRFYNKKQ